MLNLLLVLGAGAGFEPAAFRLWDGLYFL